MDKEGLIEYGQLQEGSYFGDISVIFDEPSEYSYYYDPYQVEKPLQLLEVDASNFRYLCKKYPLSKEVMFERAGKRKTIF